MRILMILVPGRGEPALRVERFAPAYYTLVDAGAEVVLASPDGGSPWGRPARRGPEDGAPFAGRLQADRTAREAMADTLSLDQVFPDDFAAAFCVGEPGRLWDVDPGDPAGGTIRSLLATGKPVAIVPGGFDLAPHGAGEGLVITGRSARSPLLAARALLAALPCTTEATMALDRHPRLAGALSVALSVASAHAAAAAGEVGVAEEGITHRPVAAERLPNVPGHSLTAVVLDLAPGGLSPPHRHPGFVFAYVLSGTVRSRLGDGPAVDYRAGQGWVEPPGTLHNLTENPSPTEPASLLAVWVSEDGAELVVPP